MRLPASLPLLLSLLLAGCASPWRPLPPQRPSTQAPDPPNHPCYVEAREPRAARMFSGVLPTTDPQAWTAARPQLTCTIPTAGPYTAAFDFDLHSLTFSHTGPVTLRFFINNRPAGQLHCPRPGPYRWRAPAGPLPPGQPATLAAQIDPVFIAPDDRQPLGVRLSAAGFLLP